MGKVVNLFFSNPPIAFTNLGVLDKEKLKFGKTIHLFDKPFFPAFLHGQHSG